MNWYYAREGQQVGPVDENEFNRLVQSGAIQQDTLVWKEGMANWEPYRQAVSSPSAPPKAASAAEPVAAGAGVVCSECGQVYAPDDVIQIAGSQVCANCKPVTMQKLREGVQLAGVMDYAGFWIRFGAKFIDGLILGVPMMVLLFAVGAFDPTAGQEPNFTAALVQFAFYPVALVYNTFFLGRYGATPGKMACNLRVVTGDGAHISYARALGRYFAEILSSIICYIGYIMAAFDVQKRALHDHICNTRVIRK